MEKILHLNSVEQYTQLYGLEAQHPLVGVVDLNHATRRVEYTHWNYGIYALYLKMEQACYIQYGRQSYDYQEGTIVCFAPGQTTETVLTTDHIQMNVLGLLFHPDFFRYRRPRICNASGAATRRPRVGFHHRLGFSPSPETTILIIA